MWRRVIAYNLGNLGWRLVLSQRMGNWSLTSLSVDGPRVGLLVRVADRVALLIPLRLSEHAPPFKFFGDLDLTRGTLW